MEMGMTPELMYGQNVYVPATANPYQYGYAGKVNSRCHNTYGGALTLIICSE